ncbi:MAG: hypothetical protein DMF70_01965 [Acidobacteria bacterium]|nr:MAG: hypothetical protein DMF70_01965 [Acidobacteriota bacterium]
MRLFFAALRLCMYAASRKRYSRKDAKAVKGYVSQEIEQGGMERFSVFFAGPGDPFLPQKVYSLEHERMGEFEIFLVPVAGDEKSYRYEAVFNYFKT